MPIHATVTLVNHRFFAALSDGRQLDREDVRKMADALFRAGVSAHDVSYEWGEGRRMITPGQQVAMRAEIRRLQSQVEGMHIAA
jgi:hypothetical protein